MVLSQWFFINLSFSIFFFFGFHTNFLSVFKRSSCHRFLSSIYTSACLLVIEFVILSTHLKKKKNLVCFSPPFSFFFCFDYKRGGHATAASRPIVFAVLLPPSLVFLLFSRFFHSLSLSDLFYFYGFSLSLALSNLISSLGQLLSSLCGLWLLFECLCAFLSS